jgi:HAD superfamily hydrolase (TIGR01509 family)
MGDRMPMLWYLAAINLAGQELFDLVQRKEALYRQLLLANPRQFVLSPGAQELIEALVSEGVPRTIATSSEITNLSFCIQHLRLDRWFHVTKIVYDDGHRPGKPAPDVYLAAAENIHTEPGECIVVEDSVSGLESAYVAGIGCIIGLGGPVVCARLVACKGMELVIESLRDFPRELLLNYS